MNIENIEVALGVAPLVEQMLSPWQEYDCPTQQADTDLHDAEMVIHGAVFYCHWCGSMHTAGVDAMVSTYNGNGEPAAIPRTLEELNALKGRA